MLIACQRIRCGSRNMNESDRKQTTTDKNEFQLASGKSVDKHVQNKFGCLFAPKTVHRTTTSRVGSLASVRFIKLPTFVSTKHLRLKHFLIVSIDVKSASSSINLNASLLFHSKLKIAHAKALRIISTSCFIQSTRQPPNA